MVFNRFNVYSEVAYFLLGHPVTLDLCRLCFLKYSRYFYLLYLALEFRVASNFSCRRVDRHYRKLS